MQSGFSVIPKIAFGNLCIPIYDVIIIPCSSENLETAEKKGKNTKIEDLENEKNFLGEIKSIFHNF